MTSEIGLLLDRWRGKRAARVNLSITQVGAFLAVISFFTDLYFKLPLLTTSGAVALFFGSLATYLISKNKTPTNLGWIPLYVSFWFAVTTNLLDTGGINSPFISGFLALLFVGGLVIQSQVRIFNLAVFVFSNLIFWILADVFSWGQFGNPPLPTFSFVINGVVISALIFCIYEFLRTEEDLASEILNHYKELSIARENLNREEAANATKSTFLANISHELRTPLGAILGYADLALDPSIADSERTDFISTIRTNGNQLLHLVNDLLDLTKVEAGKIEIEKVNFNPLEIINEVINLLNITAEKKGLRVDLIIADQKPNLLLSDPLRFRQILMNIISNAIKFSQRGVIFLIVNFPANGKDNKRELALEIQDSGPGLTIEEQKRLFKPFSQADASVTRKYGGTGLGLNLSRQLARLLDGDLTLEWTQPGVGSRFVLRLPTPLVVGQSAALVASIKNNPQSTIHKNFVGRQILIVDDNSDNQTLIQKYLQPYGAEIAIATDGMDAIKKVSLVSYDLILMDVQMPIMDGLQATTLLRQQQFTKPILALTAHAMKEDRERCMAAGFDDYLTKPIDRKLLIEKVEHYLG